MLINCQNVAKCIVVSLHVLVTVGHAYSEVSHVASEKVLSQTVDTIRNISSSSSVDYPLPLYSYWTTYQNSNARSLWFPLETQLKLIKQGYPILPSMMMPRPYDSNINLSDRRSIQLIAKLKLPISMISTQWESLLAEKSKYRSLPLHHNPNVIALNGEVENKVSPFGDKKLWFEAGISWTESKAMKMIMEVYPDPPLVILLSNNEQGKLLPADRGNSKRWATLVEQSKNEDDVYAYFSHAWIERYGSLLSGMRNGIQSDHWRSKVIFSGYNVFPFLYFGRYWGWRENSFYDPKSIYDYLTTWNGETLNIYLKYSTDCTVRSVQIELMNEVAKRQKVLSISPNYWHELIFWDGCNRMGFTGEKGVSRLNELAIKGQNFESSRLKGLLHYTLWLTRPRVLRGFGAYSSKFGELDELIKAQLDTVRFIHENVELHSFWEQGVLVVNNERKHPYNKKLTKDIEGLERFFLLECKQNSIDWTKLDSTINVFSLAYRLEDIDGESWLIYAHSPYGLEKVDLFVPGLGDVNVSCSKSGVFTIIRNDHMSVIKVN